MRAIRSAASSRLFLCIIGFANVATCLIGFAKCRLLLCFSFNLRYTHLSQEASSDMEGWSHCCTLVSNVTTVDFFICFINSVFSERGNKSNLSNGLRMVVYPVCFASETGGCHIWSSDASVFVMIRPGGSVLWPPSSAIQCSVWPTGLGIFFSAAVFKAEQQQERQHSFVV